MSCGPRHAILVATNTENITKIEKVHHDWATVSVSFEDGPGAKKG